MMLERPIEKPAPTEGAMPEIRAWVTAAWIGPGGERASAGGGALVATICVHIDVPTSARLALARDVGATFGALAGDAPSLWVFPAGFLPPDNETSDIVTSFPEGAVVVMGNDEGNIQRGLILDGKNRSPVIRGDTPLEERMFKVGALNAALFICGEVAGSRSENLGPYCGRDHLDDPARQLAGVEILVDIAHAHVRGTVNPCEPSPRMVHQAAMEAFAKGAGAAVLAHHHGGHCTFGRPRNDSSSAWIIARGRDWITPTERSAHGGSRDLHLATDFAFGNEL